jgi:DNA-binding NarL/FixJ family response regulator
MNAERAVDPGSIRVLLADDAVLFREGVAKLLTDRGLHVVGQVSDAETLVEQVSEVLPDVVVTDIRMPPTHTTEGLVAARRIRRDHPRVGVLVLSQFVEARHAVRLLEQAPERIGYLLKDRVAEVAEFVDAVRRVASGGSVVDPDLVGRLLSRIREESAIGELTEREREILGLMAEGMSNLAIGERLHLAPKTVEAHVAHIFTKLGLLPGADENRRVLAVLMYLRQQ